MRKVIIVIIASVFITGICITSCVHKPQIRIDSGYPPIIASILISKCATAGCHDQGSYQNAGGLLLDSYTHLLNGDVNGAEVVAYSTEFSSLLYALNTDSALGLVAYDPHHFSPALSHDEYMTLYNWVAAGAPDINGNIPFASNAATRQKLYITHPGCNVVAVIDGASKLVMRYIPVGDATDLGPHSFAISSDGMYGYVPFYNGNIVQKIDLTRDVALNTVNLGAFMPGGTGGLWSIAIMSPLDTAFMVSGWSSPGSIATVNTASMQVDKRSSLFNLSILPLPHGLASNAAFDTFYAALDFGNVIFKYWFKPTFSCENVCINNPPAVLTSSPTTPDPHQIQMSPDFTKYFVTCQGTNEVRVLNMHDTVLAAIPVGAYPQEMDVSPSRNLLYVTCMSDAANPNPGCLGSIYVIDMSTLQVVNVLYGNFYQPHGIAVDEPDGLLYIPSTNVAGKAHHSSACGKPGWYSVYDLNTLQPADNKQYSVPSDPYVISTRFRQRLQ